LFKKEITRRRKKGEVPYNVSLFVSQSLRYLRLDNCNTEDSISGLKEGKTLSLFVLFEAKR
jgi:hypothetical protein